MLVELNRDCFSVGLAYGQCKFADETACYWPATRWICPTEHIWCRLVDGILPQSEFVAATTSSVHDIRICITAMNIYLSLFLTFYSFYTLVFIEIRRSRKIDA